MNPTKTIAIIGGGFAGTTLARALDSRLPPDRELMLISEESYTTFNPMLPEAVGASIFPEQVVAPIRQMLSRGRFVMGRVSAINAASKSLSCSTLAGEASIAYEHVVLAFGNRARLDLIPGLAEHALPLKTVGDAMHIRNIVLRRVARIELESDPALRRTLGHFVVIGGGFSGVEVAGELVDCLKSIRRYYPRVAADALKVTILQDQARLLLELSERLGVAAHRSLSARGVDVRTLTRATSVDDASVMLADGSRLQTSTVICTIGTRPNALVQSLGLSTARGRIIVNADLSVSGSPGVWAIGDCAQVTNARDGKQAPPTAQFAVREARSLASNLLATLAGAPTQAFSYRARGSMAAIGHMNGVADLFGIPLSGLPAWLLWRAYYLSQMPTLGRKFAFLSSGLGACSSRPTSRIFASHAATSSRSPFEALHELNTLCVSEALRAGAVSGVRMNRTGRRTYASEYKLEVVRQCSGPGISVAPNPGKAEWYAMTSIDLTHDR